MSLPILALLTATSFANDPTPAAEAVKPTLVEVLSYVDVPLTQPRLEAAGASPEALATVATDPSRLPYLRMRAVAALGFYPGELALRTLRTIARDADTDREVRIAALSTLGFTAPEGIESLLLAVRDADAAPAVRDAAARALDRVEAARARQRAKSEPPRPSGPR